MTYQELEAARLRFERKFIPKVLKALGEQYARAIAGLEAGISNSDTLVTAEPIQRVFNDLYSETGVYFCKLTYRQVDKLISKDRANDLTENWLSAMREYISTTGAEQITKITNTTKKLIKRAIDAGTSQGWGTARIAQEIRANWKGISRSRALTISRTETLSASNYGSLAGAEYIQNNIPCVEVEKQWLATPDTRTRDSHKKANGQRRKLNEPFNINGKEMQHPGDPKGGASEIIKCRCAMTYHVVD